MTIMLAQEDTSDHAHQTRG